MNNNTLFPAYTVYSSVIKFSHLSNKTILTVSQAKRPK